MTAPNLAVLTARPLIADALTECLDTYRRWLYLPDDDVVLAVLGAVAANLTPGDPLWLLIVGAPGSGKTEVATPTGVMDYVHQAATLSAASLLSGTSKKEHEAGATGGLLRSVGEFGILLVKDFSGVLSMNRDARAEVLAALREVYDGSWTRHVGTGGGRSLAWNGKCGVVGCVTPSIDRHSAVMGALGERFVLYRLEVDDVKAQARRRLDNRGRETVMRAELADAVASVLELVDRTNPPRPLTDGETVRLVDLATFVVGARSAVERDGYDREVVVMPSLEAPGRLVAALGQLLAGLEAIGATSDIAWRIVNKAAWGCVPTIRTRLLVALHDDGDQRVSDLVESTGIPRTTAARTLEDLALLHLVDGNKAGQHDTAAWSYRLSAQTLADWPSPEVRHPRMLHPKCRARVLLTPPRVTTTNRGKYPTASTAGSPHESRLVRWLHPAVAQASPRRSLPRRMDLSDPRPEVRGLRDHRRPHVAEGARRRRHARQLQSRVPTVQLRSPLPRRLDETAAVA